MYYGKLLMYKQLKQDNSINLYRVSGSSKLGICLSVQIPVSSFIFDNLGFQKPSCGFVPLRVKN